MNTAIVTTTFGIAGVGLGSLELVGRPLFQRLTGMEGRDRVVVSMGVRELLTGVGLLARLSPGPWMWARAIGDVYDAVMFSTASSEANPKKTNARVMVAFSLGACALDVLGALYVTGRLAR